jgi:quinol monooxygenase YgiN
MKSLSKFALVAVAAMALPVSFGNAASADASKTGLYEISEINILPSTLTASSPSVPKLFSDMQVDTKKDAGLLNLTVTQQLGQPGNFTVIEQWKDQASLDAHVNAEHTKAFGAALEPLLSGPVYQRVFSVFQ